MLKIETKYYDLSNYYLITKRVGGETMFYKGYGDRVMFMTPYMSSLYRIKVYPSLEMATEDMKRLQSKVKSSKLRIKKLSDYFTHDTPQIGWSSDNSKISIEYQDPTSAFARNFTLLKNLKKEKLEKINFTNIKTAIFGQIESQIKNELESIQYHKKEIEESQKDLDKTQAALDNLKSRDIETELKEIVDKYKNETLDLIYGM